MTQPLTRYQERESRLRRSNITNFKRNRAEGEMATRKKFLEMREIRYEYVRRQHLLRTELCDATLRESSPTTCPNHQNGRSSPTWRPFGISSTSMRGASYRYEEHKVKSRERTLTERYIIVKVLSCSGPVGLNMYHCNKHHQRTALSIQTTR